MKSYFCILALIVNPFIIGRTWSQSLVAHYAMDNNTLDDSGNINNGKIIGGVTKTIDRFGNPCGALLFNGIDGFIEIPSSPSLNSISNQLSIAGWFKLSKINISADFRWLTLVCKGDITAESDFNPHFRLQTFQSSIQSTISINSDFTEYDFNFQKHAFEYDKWNFYVLVYDGKTVTTFLNGSEFWRFPYNKPLVPNTAPLHIGKDVPGELEYFTGALDDLRIYNVALTTSEILQLYKDNSSGNFVDEFVLHCPDNININTPNNDCYAILIYDQPQIEVQCDNGPITVKQIAGLPSGSLFPIGNSMLIFQAESISGLKKTCFTSTSVYDKTPPTIQCLNDTIIFIPNDTSTTIQFMYEFPTAYDNCPDVIVSLTEGMPIGSAFPVGINSLRFTATDNSGNTTECSYNVIVKTNTPKFTPDISVAIAPLTINSSLESNTTYSDSIKYTKGLEFDECILTVIMYDDGEQDFDTISVFFNDKEIVKRELIRRKQNGTINKVLLLEEDEKNDFIVRAWNNGNISPNTLKIEFYEGYYLDKLNKLNRIKPKETRILHSKPGLASAINLRCNAD